MVGVSPFIFHLFVQAQDVQCSQYTASVRLQYLSKETFFDELVCQYTLHNGQYFTNDTMFIDPPDTLLEKVSNFPVSRIPRNQKSVANLGHHIA
jgi:hypothetical protein